MKPKWPTGGKFLFIELYRLNVWLFTKREDWDAAVGYLGISEAKQDGQLGISMSANRDNENIFLVGVFDGDHGTLVHELAHTTLDMCTMLSFDPQAGNGEPFAYMQGYMFDKFHQFIKHKSRATKKASI